MARRFAIGAALVAAACSSGEGSADLSELPWEPVRAVMSLNGQWEAGQGALDVPPALFDGVVPVPGLISAAVPPFAEVGEESSLRDGFWVRRSFIAPPPADNARLVVRKAKFGSEVWLNGTRVGGNEHVYTTTEIEVGAVLKFGERNEVMIRVGEDRSKVMRGIPAGQDREKEHWVPGVYDDVQLVTTGRVRIARVKIEPDIDRGRIVIKTTVDNRSSDDCTLMVEHHVVTHRAGDAATRVTFREIDIEPGRAKDVEQVLNIADAHLWSPEDPFLYRLKSAVRVEGELTDSLETRFGMRKLEFRDARFFLNNERYFLRGSNIALYRFFEDPDVGNKPFDENWVRKLLGEHPKALNWNIIRFHVGRAPNFWYDLADEIGLLIVDEFMMWTVLDTSSRNWSFDQLEHAFTSWMQENWNHPSIVWWDGCNETFNTLCTDTIKRVRHLDGTRSWEAGGYNPPVAPNDPIEDHPYLFISLGIGGVDVDLRRMESNDGQPPKGGAVGTEVGTTISPGHPYINNEYGWFWVNRNGTPTTLTARNWQALLGPGPHPPATYYEGYGYVVGGLTEFWRARRGYAGVMHFVYLTYSRPGGETSDSFIDLDNLVLEPRWKEYASHAFAPVMPYLDTWREDWPTSSTATVPVVVINDLGKVVTGTLTVLAVRADGTVAARTELPLGFAPYGTAEESVDVATPAAYPFMLVAKFAPDGGVAPVAYSRRKVGYPHVGAAVPDPPYAGE